MNKQTLRDINVTNKRVLVRVDFNVPLDGARITDDTRIRASLPTIQYLLDHNAKTILMSHLGRPKGVDEKLRLKPCAVRLSELLGQPVQTVSDCIGDEVRAAAQALNTHARCCCWKISASTRKKRRTTPLCQASWPSWATCT